MLEVAATPSPARGARPKAERCSRVAVIGRDDSAFGADALGRRERSHRAGKMIICSVRPFWAGAAIMAP
jgi:hypothetical protein